MNSITANDLKTRGVKAVEEALQNEEEVLVSVRGRNAYVVTSVENWARMREYELESAIREVRADYEAGRYETGSVEDHIKRITE